MCWHAVHCLLAISKCYCVTDAVLENDADETAQAAVTAVTQLKLACQLQLELCTTALLQLVTALCSSTAAPTATGSARTVSAVQTNTSF
jgi:hypothetical protein